METSLLWIISSIFLVAGGILCLASLFMRVKSGNLQKAYALQIYASTSFFIAYVLIRISIKFFPTQ